MGDLNQLRVVQPLGQPRRGRGPFAGAGVEPLAVVVSARSTTNSSCARWRGPGRLNPRPRFCKPRKRRRGGVDTQDESSSSTRISGWHRPACRRPTSSPSDRVVCCDPDYGQLLELCLGKARRLFAYSYPRDRASVRAVVAIQNAMRRLRGTRFRVFVHPPGRMTALIRAAGFVEAFRARTLIWQIEVHTRVPEDA
jgi:hypothetical protein